MSRNETAGQAAPVDVSVEPHDQFLADVMAGLASTPKRIPSKYFYDEAGSRLFDRITELPEYYPTRTEVGIMRQNVRAIASCLGSNVVLIEYGSGSSTKTRLILDQLDRDSTYVPIDISGDHLQHTASELARDYPNLSVIPVHADYSKPVNLPEVNGRRVVYYPGSTIGNFEPLAAQQFLSRMRRIVGDDGGVLIGIDLEKDPAILEAAYNDSEGVTAAFNLNILRRANSELGADFDLTGFRHRAVYCKDEGRIEMHLVSQRHQVVHVGDQSFQFVPDEYIHTENSYKYRIERFSKLVSDIGFTMTDSWTDAKDWFCVAFLTSSA
ncbi:MAG: L-histidine N(alpha)-methyltransferase [Rhodothermia bacterium]|nr:L-histidine N(alpha)-methyltransferase [Rhodothermia bacterium]